MNFAERVKAKRETMFKYGTYKRVLTCQTDNHDKYYCMVAKKQGKKYVAKAFYGQIGNSPQVHDYEFSSKDEAVRFIDKQESAKLKKGYEDRDVFC